jgi:hypothetical protein
MSHTDAARCARFSLDMDRAGRLVVPAAARSKTDSRGDWCAYRDLPKSSQASESWMPNVSASWAAFCFCELETGGER